MLPRSAPALSRGMPLRSPYVYDQGEDPISSHKDPDKKAQYVPHGVNEVNFALLLPVASRRGYGDHGLISPDEEEAAYEDEERDKKCTLYGES